jgi:hypothetical protein
MITNPADSETRIIVLARAISSLTELNICCPAITLALSNGPNRVSVSNNLALGLKLMQFLKRCVLKNTGR